VITHTTLLEVLVPAILLMLGNITVAVINLKSSRAIETKQTELHVMVNDRMTKMLDLNEKASLAEGKAQGVQQERDRKGSPQD